jgi:hypothetical protein
LPDRVVQEAQREILGAIYTRVFSQVGADHRLSPRRKDNSRPSRPISALT